MPGIWVHLKIGTGLDSNSPTPANFFGKNFFPGWPVAGNSPARPVAALGASEAGSIGTSVPPCRSEPMSIYSTRN